MHLPRNINVAISIARKKTEINFFIANQKTLLDWLLFLGRTHGDEITFIGLEILKKNKRNLSESLIHLRLMSTSVSSLDPEVTHDARFLCSLMSFFKTGNLQQTKCLKGS